MNEEYDLLNFVWFEDIEQWDSKHFARERIKSKYPIVYLSECLNEENAKFNISDPKNNYKILGVNNQNGIFDAYIENGAKINQKYKKMEVDWIAYNPYRINVGSIGIKTEYNKYEYISPAYVVFSCFNNIRPYYLFYLMKTKRFNSIIKDNTTGSVRQNLSFDILSSLQIPIPDLHIQDNLIDGYNSVVQEADLLFEKAKQLEEDIQEYIDSILGIEYKSNDNEIEIDGMLQFVEFEKLEEWGVDKMTTTQIHTSKYNKLKVKDICKLSSGGTPSRTNPSYYQGDIPWIKTGEVVNEVIVDTEEHISKEAVKNSSARLYPKGSLIIAMYGQGDTRGRTAKLGIDATTNQACAVMYNIDNSIIDTDYLWYYFQSRYNDLRSLAVGNNQPNLNAGMILNYDVVIPPMPVQLEIVSYISKKKNEIKELKSQAVTLRAKALEDFEKEIFDN